jgi:hypothetical protein
LVLVFFFVSKTFYAQYSWSDIAPLIPEHTNSKNLSLNTEGFVWEYTNDSASTSIYYKPLQYDPVCLASTPGIKYTNPYIFSTSPSTIYILFERIENGNKDILYSAVDEIGTILVDAEGLVVSPANDHDFSVHYNSVFRKLTWMEENKVKVGSLQFLSNHLLELNEIHTIDSGDCANPVLGSWNGALHWIKKYDSLDVIRYSEPDRQGWTTPVNIDTANQIKSLDICTNFFPVLHWTFLNDSGWRMKDYFNLGNNPQILIPNVEQDHSIDFDTYYAGITVKDKIEFWGENFFQTFIKLQDGYDEVFLNDEFEPDTYYNFSAMGTNCRKPQFFLGEGIGPYSNWFYLTWEASIGDAWNIYYSEMQVDWGGGGIEESKSVLSNITVSPNPCISNIEIRFDLDRPSQIELDILDDRGNFLLNFSSENLSQGSFLKTLTLPSTIGYSGVCFLRIEADGKYAYKKLVRVK